jgi:hypothetical protein
MPRAPSLILLASLLGLGVPSATAGGVGLAPSPAFGARSAAFHTEARLPLSLSPVPEDLALAEVGLHAPIGKRIPADPVRITLRGPFGSDYMAVATPRTHASSGAQVLVLLVNRPSALLDPATVKLLLGAPRWLAVSVVARVSDPFTGPPVGKRLRLCDLTRHRSPLRAGALRRLQSNGAPLRQLSATFAVAQAYNAVCGLPVDQTFKRAVTGSSGQSPASPPAPTPAPTPEPRPIREPPGCRPCHPPPGYACPLAAASICVSPVRAFADRTGPAGR